MIEINEKKDMLKKLVQTIEHDIDQEGYLEFFSIAFDIHGNPSFYYSGNWQNLAKASAFLQNEFNRHCDGEA